MSATGRIILLLATLLVSKILQGQNRPTDPLASRKTVKLYQNLKKLAREGLMFGHQDDLAYGIGWKYEAEGSDIKYTLDDYPAVFGWDLGHLELGEVNNIDSIPFDLMRYYIKEAYKMGGVNTISWHLHNPITGENSWSKANSLDPIFPGGAAHEKYRQWLDRLADFLNSLKLGFGKKIPVILRLYHEHNGDWFWWGKAHCSPDQYKRLWKMTVDHLRARKVHHVLYAYSPDKFTTEKAYLERYPGDDYIDIIGFDAYHRGAPKSNEKFIKEARFMAETVSQLATRKNKIAAWTETGLETIGVNNWWTGVLGEVVKDLPLSYALVWRNAHMKHFYAPYPDHKSVGDFKQFHAWDDVFFQSQVANFKLYKNLKIR